MTEVIPRVVHLVPALFDEKIGVIGGAERYAFELARHMARYTPTRLVTFGPADEKRECEDLEIEVIGKPHYVRGQSTNPISHRLIRHLGASDVVHCHQLNVVATTVAAVFCRLTGRRAFVTDLGGGGWGVSAYINTERWFDGHLHVSRFSERIARHGTNTRSEVIWGGVDIDFFVPANSEAVSSTVLFVGRILAHKGIHNLIRALPEGLRLEVVGRAYDTRYFAELQKLSSGKNVAFITDLDDIQLLAAYQRAACVVLPSVYTDLYGNYTAVPELLGQTLLEGMACGLAAICTNVGAMPEIVLDRVTGFVVSQKSIEELRARLEWIRDHPKERVVMGERGRARVREMFTWDRVTERCLKAYSTRRAPSSRPFPRHQLRVVGFPKG